MFKRDPKGRFSSREQSFFFFWKNLYWRFHSGRSSTEEMNNKTYSSLMEHQQQKPVEVMTDPLSNKTWWMFKGEFYWEDEQFSVKEVTILILDNLKQRKKRVERAAARINQGNSRLTRRREPIPDPVKVNVWQRDRGRCVKCGSQEALEFDHIIPLSKGGGNTTRNIQLLCEKCNREKAGNLA